VFVAAVMPRLSLRVRGERMQPDRSEREHNEASTACKLRPCKRASCAHSDAWPEVAQCGMTKARACLAVAVVWTQTFVGEKSELFLRRTSLVLDVALAESLSDGKRRHLLERVPLVGSRVRLSHPSRFRCAVCA
jgi:hypothetical protein